MSKSFVVAIFAEGEFAGIVPHHTEECADAYADGVRRGKGIVRSSHPPSVHTYVLPRDTADMSDDQHGEEFDSAMEAYAAHTENQRLTEEHD